MVRAPDEAGIIAAIAQNVRAKRKALQLSQEKLAFEAGVDRTYVSQVERRQRNLTVTVLARLAKALKVSPEEQHCRGPRVGRGSVNRRGRSDPPMQLFAEDSRMPETEAHCPSNVGQESGRHQRVSRIDVPSRRACTGGSKQHHAAVRLSDGPRSGGFCLRKPVSTASGWKANARRPERGGFRCWYRLNGPPLVTMLGHYSWASMMVITRSVTDGSAASGE